MVLFFESTAIIDAILLKKRIVTIISSAMDKTQIKAGFHWIKELGIEKINIEDDLIVDAGNKNAFLLIFLGICVNGIILTGITYLF